MGLLDKVDNIDDAKPAKAKPKAAKAVAKAKPRAAKAVAKKATPKAAKPASAKAKAKVLAKISQKKLGLLVFLKVSNLQEICQGTSVG